MRLLIASLVLGSTAHAFASARAGMEFPPPGSVRVSGLSLAVSTARSVTETGAGGEDADDLYLPDSGAPYLTLDGARPTRWGDSHPGDGHGVVVAVDALPTALAVHRVDLDVVREPTEEDLADQRALRASLGDRVAPSDSVTFLLEGPNAILFDAKRTRPRQGIGAGPGSGAGPGGIAFKVVSGRARTDAAHGDSVVEIQRTWFVWYDALNADGKPDQTAMKRAALLMPGMFGNPEPTLDRLVKRLRVEGYGVLRMLSQPSRFTQTVEFRINAGDLGASASVIAAVLGDRAAECGYASENAWAHIEAHRPGVRSVPAAVLGASGGAITLPTVLAMRPDRYRAAVLMAGSADFWLTNERSNYRGYIDAMRSYWNEPPTAAQIAELDRLYLGGAPLDNFHTAAALRAKAGRVLMMQGLIDRAAPSELSDVLWERSGRPERWTYPVGHELFFATLPQEFDRIVAWLNGALEAN